MNFGYGKCGEEGVEEDECYVQENDDEPLADGVAIDNSGETFLVRMKSLLCVTSFRLKSFVN